MSQGQKKGTIMLIKLNTNSDQDSLIEKLKQHFGEATASKAVMAAVENYLSLYFEAERQNADNIGLKCQLHHAKEIFDMQSNVEYNRKRFLEQYAIDEQDR